MASSDEIRGRIIVTGETARALTDHAKKVGATPEELVTSLLANATWFSGLVSESDARRDIRITR